MFTHSFHFLAFIGQVKYRLLAISLTAALCILISWLVVLQPNWAEVEQLQRDIGAQAQKINDKNQFIKQQTIRNNLTARLEDALKPLYASKPHYIISTDLVTQIEAWSFKNEVDLIKVRWGDFKQAELFDTQSISLTFASGYAQLVKLVNYLNRFAANLLITEVNMFTTKTLPALTEQQQIITLKVKLQIIMLSH